MSQMEAGDRKRPARGTAAERPCGHVWGMPGTCHLRAVSTAVQSPSGPKHTLSGNQPHYHSSPLALWPPRTGAGTGQREQPQKVEPALFFPLGAALCSPKPADVNFPKAQDQGQGKLLGRLL